MKTRYSIQLGSLLLLAGQAIGIGATINFEQIAGVVPFEGMAISNQFRPYYGISFRRAPGASAPWPTIARVGEPPSAYARDGTDESDTVTAGWAANIGTFYLTDNAEDASASSALILDFESPVSQASGYILDIDAAERVVVSAYTDSTTTNAFASTTFTKDSPNTGDGVATPWSFSRPTRDIYRIEIKPFSAMIGYDLFSSNYAPPATPPPSLALQLHPGLTIEGTTGRPYRIDYSEALDRTTSNTNWHFLTNIFLPHSPYLFIDQSPAIAPERYYRATAIP